MPLPDTTPVTAMPSTAPASTSVTDAPSRLATISPAFVVWSSVIVVNIGAAGVSIGASLTAVTVIDAVSVAVENAVVPPFVDASTLVPCVPLARSHARNVNEPRVRVLPSGTKRSRSVSRSSSALLSATAPTPPRSRRRPSNTPSRHCPTPPQ